jgi:DNA polymerase-3 subunit alpha
MGDSQESFQRIYEQPKLPEWPDHVIWEGEKEMLGLYISSHPLQNYRDLVERYSTLDLKDTSLLKEGEEVMIAGLVSTVRAISTKKGTRMAFLRLETLLGPCEVTIFSDLYEQKSTLLVADLVVVCAARVNYRDDKLGFVANDLVPIDDAERLLTKAVHVRVHPPRQQTDVLDKLALILGSVPGACDVYLHCGLADGGEVVIHAPNACRVSATRQLRLAIEDLMGQDTVYFSAGMRLPSYQTPRVYQQPAWKQRAERRAEN